MKHVEKSSRLCAISLFAIAVVGAVFAPPFGPWRRLSSEPVLSPRGSGFESAGTFNPAVVKERDKFVMLYRAHDGKGTSSLGYATSDDGVHFSQRPEPVMVVMVAPGLLLLRLDSIIRGQNGHGSGTVATGRKKVAVKIVRSGFIAGERLGFGGRTTGPETYTVANYKTVNARTTDPRGFACCLLIALLILPPGNSSQTARDYERAMADFHKGDYSSAAELFVKVEVASPGTTEALLFEGKCLIHLEKYQDAERALRSYVGRRPNSDEGLYLLGFVLYRQNKPAESLAMYTKGAALKRPAGDDLKIVGLDYVMLNDYADAVKWLERAVELEPKNKEAWYYLGRAYYTEKDVPDAQKAFLTVLDLDPRDARAENNLGLIFESEAKVTQALDAYRQAIAWQQGSPRPSEQPYVNLGNLLMKEGRTEEAIPHLQRAVSLAPSNAFCHLKLGEAYRRVHRSDEARRELERATQLEPENATVHYQLGRLYQEIHDRARAQAEFDRTMELQIRGNSPTPQPPTE